MIHNDITIFLPIKCLSYSMGEDIFKETIKMDKECLLREYNLDQFDYKFRVDEYDNLLTISKRKSDDE
jgi:hypothetical protein